MKWTGLTASATSLRKINAAIVFAALCAQVLTTPGAAPPNYYRAAEGLAGPELARALKDIISPHRIVRYSSTVFDTSDALRILDEDPSDANAVVGVYSRARMRKADFGLTTGWNREHVWPESYGIDGDTTARTRPTSFRP